MDSEPGLVGLLISIAVTIVFFIVRWLWTLGDSIVYVPQQPVRYRIVDGRRERQIPVHMVGRTIYGGGWVPDDGLGDRDEENPNA